MVIALRNFWVVMRYLTCYNECNYRDMKYIKHKLRNIYKTNKDKEIVNDIFMFEDKYNTNEKFARRDV